MNASSNNDLLATTLIQQLPQGMADLNRFEQLARDKQPFTFVRFSDGEIEVLRNRKLIIAAGVTQFRGQSFTNQFPEFDQKRFDPLAGQVVRRDLLASAIYRDDAYFKGIPARHNKMIVDREFMLRLNGGFTNQLTFADLFLNSNFLHARSHFFPFLIDQFSTLRIIANWRCTLQGLFAQGELITIPDDFFSCYQETLDKVLAELLNVPEHALILASASSLSNVLGHRLRLVRPDLTFIDIGTALNDMIGLPLGTRAYHKLLNPTTWRDKLAAWRYRQHREYQLQW